MNMTRFLRWTVVVGALLALVVLPLAARADERIEQKFEKIESLEKDGKVILSNISGMIEVRGWSQGQVKIEALKISRADTAELAKENAGKVEIAVEKTGNILRIETKYPESRRFRRNGINVSVNYKVWIPENASINVRSVSGAVTAEGIGGAFEGNITSGHVTLSKINGGIDCRAVSGGITAMDVVGDIGLRTVSGSISLERAKGSAELETTSGGIKMIAISGAKSVRAKVLSGSISYEGELEKDGRYSLEALSGRIEMIVPSGSGFEIEAESFSGGIDTDFPITVSGRISRRELRGVIGNGGAVVRLKSFSGSINLKKK